MERLESIKIEQLFVKKTSEQKVMGLFYRNPYREFTMTGVSALAGVSKSQASSIIRKLSAEGLVVLEELGKKSWRIRANNENFAFRKKKIAHNLDLIYSSNIVEFLNEHYKNPKAIVLFGSFRWGEDGKGSDIDIAAEILKEKELEINGFKEFKPFEKALERKIRIHVFNRKHIDNNLFANIANGIVLYGFLEVNK